MGRLIFPFNAKIGWMTTFLCHVDLIQKWKINQLTVDISWTCISSLALFCCTIGLGANLVQVLQFVISYCRLLSQSRKLSRWLIEFSSSYLFVYWFPSKILINTVLNIAWIEEPCLRKGRVEWQCELHGWIYWNFVINLSFVISLSIFSSS